MIDTCLTEHANGTVLEIKVQPRSSRNQIIGLQDGALKIKLTSPPVDGAANKACLNFLAKQLGFSKNSIEILTGETSRHKRIMFKGIAAEEVNSALSRCLE